MIIAYNYITGEIIAKETTISSLSIRLGIPRCTISKHVNKNKLRELQPTRYAGNMVFIDDTYSTIITRPETPADNDYYVYKASTGEYIGKYTLKSIAAAFKTTSLAGLKRAVNNYAIFKYNIYITSFYQGESITPPAHVYEIYDCNNNLQTSTFRPETYSNLVKKSQYIPNKYKYNYYIAHINYTHFAEPAIDYCENPEKILDNNKII